MKKSALVALALTTLVLGGCSKIKEKIAEKASEHVTEAVLEKATGADVDLGSSSGSVTVTDPKTGGVARVGASLPDNWPSSVPIYPGGKVVGSFDVPDGKQVTFTSTDGVDKVHAFYKAKLPGKQEAAMDLGESKMLSHKDGETTYAAMVAKSGDDTTVQLTVHEQKKR